MTEEAHSCWKHSLTEGGCQYNEWFDKKGLVLSLLLVSYADDTAARSFA